MWIFNDTNYKPKQIYYVRIFVLYIFIHTDH